MLRIREDAGWYGGFSLAKLHFDTHMYFKNCKHWHGLNDKFWIGRRNLVLKLQTQYRNEFLTKERNNTETSLKEAALNVSRMIRVPVSDAKMREDRTICWYKLYLCEEAENLPTC